MLSRMLRARDGLLAVSLALLTSPLACHGDDSKPGGAAPNASAAGDDDAAASASASIAVSASVVFVDAAAPAIPRHAGFAGQLLREALTLDGITDDQRDAIGKLGPPLDSDDVRAAYRSFRSDLAAGVRTGAVDKAKSAADDAAVDKAAAAEQQRQADAIDGLHAALDGGMRKALTASVRAKRAALEHGPVVVPDAGAPELQKRRLDRLTHELGLDDAQQKQVAALVGRSEVVTPATIQARRDDLRKRTDALLAAFEQDTFSAKRFDLTMTPGRRPHEVLDKQATFYGALTGLLKPEQRARLAARIDRGPVPTRPGARGESTFDPSADEVDLLP